MKNIAARGLSKQVRNPGDYVGPDGLLMCGKCGEAKQRIMDFADPTPENPEHTRQLKVATMCRCEREIEEQQKERGAGGRGHGANPNTEKGKPHG